jgi:rSAM/selenodomain-associated transferase 1
VPPVRVVVFAKAPRRGLVKTRLRLDPALALRLHDAFVRDTVALARAFSGDVELCTDVETDAWRDLAVARGVQAPGDLGARLLAALNAAFARDARPVLVLGSDSPALPAAHLDSLLALAADVALGPAADGGFWGILCRRAHPALFEGVEWSSARTLETARAAAERAGLTVALGPEWYDVDEPADLARLAGEESPRASVEAAREAVAAARFRRPAAAGATTNESARIP